MRRAATTALLAGIALAASAAPAGAAVSFEAQVSPAGVSFPGTTLVTYTLSATTGPAEERFSVRPIPPLTGGGPAIEQLGYPTLSGAAAFGPRVRRVNIGVLRCTTFSPFSRWRRGVTFRHDVIVAANSTATLTYRFRVTRPPWPGVGMAPVFNVSNSLVDPALGPSTLAAPLDVTAPEPAASGQRAVAISIRTKPKTFGYNSGRSTFPRRGQRFTILGRTAPARKGRLIRLLTRFWPDNPAKLMGKIHTFATVRTDARGRFVHRGWRPTVPGSYEVGARFTSPGKGLAPGWSCARQFSLF